MRACHHVPRDAWRCFLLTSTRGEWVAGRMPAKQAEDTRKKLQVLEASLQQGGVPQHMRLLLAALLRHLAAGDRQEVRPILCVHPFMCLPMCARRRVAPAAIVHATLYLLPSTPQALPPAGGQGHELRATYLM